MGAAYILVGEDNWGIGWQFWEEALKLRDQHPKIPKNPHRPSDILLLAMKESTSEFQSLKELLETMYSHDSLNGKREEQALLGSKRILKMLGKDKSNLFLIYCADRLMRRNYDKSPDMTEHVTTLSVESKETRRFQGSVRPCLKFDLVLSSALVSRVLKISCFRFLVRWYRPPEHLAA